MTKLEEKLKELGYENNVPFSPSPVFQRDFDIYFGVLYLNKEKTKIIGSSLNCFLDICINSQKDINDLQIAFNNLQRDLKILKEVEE